MPILGGKSKSSSKSSKSAARGRPIVQDGDLQELISLKDPNQWTVGECAAWLESIELGELREAFAENSIAGSELLELSEDDMKSMGVGKLGHRKKLLKKIAALRGENSIAGSSSHTAQTSTVADSSGHEDDSGRGSDRISVKCMFRDEWYSIKITRATTFKSLRRQLEDQFECRLRIKYADTDGDQVTIKREADLQDCLRESSQRRSSRIKLYLYERDSGSSSAAPAEKPLSAQQRTDMFSVFEFILDPVIIISETGIVQYANKKVEGTLGFTQSDLIGRNVNLIMTEDIKPYHDNFLRNYLKTGVTRIIGRGRDVIAVKKDGSIMPIHLEVSEKSMGSGKLYFIGIMKEAKSQTQEKSLLQQEREVLDTLIVPAIIIDSVGSVCGCNKAAQDFLGYGLVDVINKNVSMFMPSPQREEHDGYLKAYMETGKAKVIGVGRRVVAQHKDGALIPVFLTVTEKRDKDKRFFTGILQEVQTAVVAVPHAKHSAAADKK